MPAGQQTAVLEVAGVHWASEKAVAETVLGRRPGVLAGRGQPGGADRDRHLRPRPDLGGRARAAGSATAATTAPGSPCPGTSATRRRSHTAGRAAADTARRGTRARHEHAGARRHDRRTRRWATAAPRRHVDGRHGPRHAQPVPGRRGAVDPDRCCGRRSAARCSGSPSPAPFGLRDDVFSLLLSPAGGLLLGLDLLRRRLPGAARADAGHDGAGRRRGRRRLAVQRRWSP